MNEQEAVARYPFASSDDLAELALEDRTAKAERAASAGFDLAKALAIFAIEFARVAPGRVFSLLTLDEELQTPLVRAILANPDKFLREVAGRPGGVPKDTKVEVRPSGVRLGAGAQEVARQGLPGPWLGAPGCPAPEDDHPSPGSEPPPTAAAPASPAGAPAGAPRSGPPTSDSIAPRLP